MASAPPGDRSKSPDPSRRSEPGSRAPSQMRPIGVSVGIPHLRAGFLTSAARRGASVFKVRDVSRHKSMNVLQAYVRDADLFRDTGRG
jgi:hypothetical protein